MNPLVSVVIPTYNRAEDLKRALMSVISQTYSHWECLVVDNHSNDDTDAMIEQLHDLRIKPFKIHNHGVIAASRNLGIQHATGQYIAFLDSDDWWAPIKLEKSVYYLEQGADVVYHELKIKSSKKRFTKRLVPCRAVIAPVYDDLMRKGNALPNSSVVVKTDILRKIGQFSENRDLIAAEDFEGWCRIAQLTDRFVHIPFILGYYWLGDTNMSTPKRHVSNLIYLREKYLLPYTLAHGIDMPVWWLYSYARALFLIQDNHAAKIVLLDLMSRELPLFIRLKVGFMLLLLVRKRSNGVE